MNFHGGYIFHEGPTAMHTVFDRDSWSSGSLQYPCTVTGHRHWLVRFVVHYPLLKVHDQNGGPVPAKDSLLCQGLLSSMGEGDDSLGKDAHHTAPLSLVSLFGNYTSSPHTFEPCRLKSYRSPFPPVLTLSCDAGPSAPQTLFNAHVLITTVALILIWKSRSRIRLDFVMGCRQNNERVVNCWKRGECGRWGV